MRNNIFSNDERVYNSNPNLKSAYVNVDWTPELVEEYIKCSQDINYFIRTYVKIINLDKGLVPFDLYDYQEEMANLIVDNRFVIIKTPRQAGKTTAAAAVILWHVLFNENYSVGILANKLSTSREILSRVKRAFEYLPKWLQQGVIVWNKTNIELENGSTIQAASTSSDSIRGMSLNFLYLDEFAHVKHTVQNEFFDSVYPTIISGENTKVIITSTPKGFDLFYRIWTNSVEGRNEYANFSVNWADVPGRDEEWKRKTIANIGDTMWEQEFEAAFLGSSDTLISPSRLRTMTFENPTFTFYENKMKVYREPKKDHVYIIIVDTSRGVGIDSNSFVVFDCTEVPYVVACVYDNPDIDPLVYPDIIYQAGKKYNEAFVLVEINDNGQQVADILQSDLEYENVLFTTMKKGYGNGQTIGGGFGQNTRKGVKTTAQVKRIGCSNIKSMIESDQFIINDADIVQQISSFIRKGVSYEADSGSHDDLVMCLVLFAWVTNQPFFKEVTNTDFRKKLMESRAQLMDEDILPFGIIDDGRNDEDILTQVDDLTRKNQDNWVTVDNGSQW